MTLELEDDQDKDVPLILEKKLSIRHSKLGA